MENEPGKKSSDPIIKKADVQQSNDEHIDQDFPGFPSNPAKENIISPKTHADHVAADAEDVEVIPQNKAAKEKDEIESNGSGAAFSGTEEFSEDNYDDRLDEK